MKFLLSLLCLFSISVTAQIKSTNGLVSYYKFDHLATVDNFESGGAINEIKCPVTNHTYDGDVYNMVSAKDRDGVDGKAYDFNPFGAIIDIGTDTSELTNPDKHVVDGKPYQFKGAFSISFYICPMEMPYEWLPEYGAHFPTLFSNGFSGVEINAQLSPDSLNTDFLLRIGNKDLAIARVPQSGLFKWHNIVLTYDGNKTTKGYVDGILTNTTVATVPARTFDASTWLGNPHFDHNIASLQDDWQFYNREITADEVPKPRIEANFDIMFSQTCLPIAYEFFPDSTVVNEGSVVSYTWDYGDGTPPTTDSIFDARSFREHLYYSEGTFNVTLTVTDELGNTYTKTKAVTTQPVHPFPLHIGNDTAVVKGNPVTLISDIPVNYTGERTYQWSTGAPTTEDRITVTDSGRYWLSIDQGGNCIATDTVTVSYLDAPLPLKLLSFTGSAKANIVTLHWSTADENAFSYFQIERSTDGRQFLAVGKINHGVGNYFFTDTISAKTAYYRLSMVDLNGSSELSPIVQIVLNLRTGFSIYPNPAISTVQITGEGILTIVTASGAEVLHKVITGNCSLDLSTLGRGIYYAVLTDNSGRKSLKLIKL